MVKYAFILISIALVFISCEDVIEVDTTTGDPRLVVDALIRVDTAQSSTKVVVKVAQTSNFFESIVPVSLEQITLENQDFPTTGTDPVLVEELPGSGIYSKTFNTDYLTEGRLLLRIDFGDQFYIAYASFVPAVPIDSLVNGDGILLDEDDKEVIITFTDDAERDDFYLFDFGFGNYLVTEDEFYQGQQFEFSYFYDDQVEVGDEVTVSIMGTDEPFFNFMDQIIEQSEENFGPFQIPTVTVRGNIINATGIDDIDELDNLSDPDNFALGYFAVVQEFKSTLILAE